MPLSESAIDQLNWRKSRRSLGNGECVEVAATRLGVAVRDSKNPRHASISYTPEAWRNFIEGAKAM
jgi:hypothetical protein